MCVVPSDIRTLCGSIKVLPCWLVADPEAAQHIGVSHQLEGTMSEEKEPADKELSDDQLEEASGGVVNIPKVLGTDGESNDANHDKWIDVLAEDWPEKSE